MPGLAIGTMTRSRVRNSPQPSTRAASRYSSRDGQQELPQQEDGERVAERHRDDQRPQRARTGANCCAQNRYIGMTMTCGGSIIVEMTSISASLRPRKRNLASA